MISIKNFTKRYKDTEVYNGFNLDIEENGITFILGESGSGKTTLLNAIAGLIPYEGEITRKKCSYIFQEPTLAPNLTVRGNLSLVCGDDGAVSDMIERVGLKDKQNSYPINLSGGEAQRVAIARAFLYKSDILLMDEPFSSLDLKIKKQVIELFFELWREDKRTVIAVTHDVDEAVSMSQRILILSRGRIKCDIPLRSPVPREVSVEYGVREKIVENLT